MDVYNAVVVFMITVVVWKLYFAYQSTPRSIIHEETCTKIAITSKQCIDLINELESYQPHIVGFDIEWSSKKEANENNNNKVSLIQIGHKNLIILIRLNVIKNIPGKLHDFLGNIKILKAGIGIHEDKKKLETDYNLSVHGCIDINHIFNNKLSQQTQSKLKSIYYQKDRNDLTKQEQRNTFGLNSMCNLLFGEKMKYKNVKYTFHEKWNDYKLSINHIHYAADDALIGYKLFIKLMSIIEEEQIVNGIYDSYLTLCYGLIDMKQHKKKVSNSSKSKPNIHKTNKTEEKKAEELVIENCVVCDKEEKRCDLVKYYIVPTLYFRYMNKDCIPDNNNTILACKSCKKSCNKNADKFRDELCHQYNISATNTKKQLFIKASIAAYDLSDNKFEYKLKKQCPAWHGLKQFNTETENFECDECGQNMGAKQVMWGCRVCNYDLCDNCYNDKDCVYTKYSIRYKLPINTQINMLKDICCYYNLCCDVIYKANDSDDEKNEEEYKWQWYNGDSQFQDYDDDVSEKIENGYDENNSTMRFEINWKTKKMKKEKISKYFVNFELMEQENEDTKYKRDVRRIYKKDNPKLKQCCINKFDHLIQIMNYSKCCIDITTNEILLCCIDDIIRNGKKTARLLQKEQYDFASRRLIDIFKDTDSFIQIWKENFINNMKPINYKP